ncbi:MAG TPA: carbon starvation CstA family protein [Candidatus Binatia bacterium]|nr:carbon starvation CstA family protein [Candidatus Binatia bacterium]
MSLPVLAAIMISVLALGYRWYGKFVASQYRLDPHATTPAVRFNDGVDFVPTRPFYLLGQHFSAIAAAGPIAGPIMAGQQFGWLPSLLWIGLGVVFIGAVHDFSTLVASVRHEGKSIAEVIRLQLGHRAWVAICVFIWVALVYVIVAFTDVTASTFVSGDEELEGLDLRFNAGGAVAMAAVLYLLLAIALGLVERYLRPPLWLSTVIFVPATLGAVWAGTQLSTVLVLGQSTWSVLILLYCFAASLTPVWALLQPRGYLGGFVLYLALAAGVIGIFFGGFDVVQPAFALNPPQGATSAMFPFLFVTIACGACSGFHGLVCSGTTSKQIENEAHCTPVGYGAMLLEGFVAVIALTTVMIARSADLVGKGPGVVYSEGLGRFLTVVLGSENLVFATTFGAMAFSTFIFDTLDVSTRLGRYILQELLGWQSKAAAVLATAVTCAVPLLFVLAAGAGAYRSFWTLFGTSNQLLAGLSLLGVSVWLKRSGRRYWYTLYPMMFVLGITFWSLVLQVQAGLSGATMIENVNGVVCLLLLGLAAALLWFGGKALLEPASRAHAVELT